MARSDGFDPTGMLLISDGELWLCCCRELDEALSGQLFYMRSQLFDARSYEDDEIICGSSDVCPFCGARNMLRYGHDGSNLDWTTWYRDLNVFAGEMKERLSELEAERNRLSETLRWMADVLSEKCGSGDFAKDVVSDADLILGNLDDAIRRLRARIELLEKAVEGVREESCREGWDDIERQWE